MEAGTSSNIFSTAALSSEETRVGPVGKLKVLFVDDDRSVLQGLRRMLRNRRKSWDMRFASGGREALETLAEVPADVVVSDLRMPEINGADLLTEIKERWPEAVRIILSGDTDKAAIFRTIGPAHQFLTKPCSAEQLCSAITRAGAMRRVLTNDRISSLVAGQDALPTLPALYNELKTLLQADDVPIARIGQVIGRDMGMTAKVLKLVNSAFFGLRRRITNPADAVNILGLETIHGLVLSTQAFEVMATEDMHGVDLEQLNAHVLRVAIMAKEVVTAMDLGKEAADGAFVAGMMHDLGRIILAARMPEQYGWTVDAAGRRGVELNQAERKVFRATHGEVGAYLLGLWGVADPVIEAVAWHHDPGQAASGLSPLLIALHLANAVDEISHPQRTPPGGIDDVVTAALGGAETVAKLTRRCTAVLERGGPADDEQEE